MRVISGYLRGRVIKGYDVVGTRPTMDRVKESVFSTIYDKINDSVVLDLFCGSGSLGIEAISNYAKYVYFVDNNKVICNILKENIDNFKINDKVMIINRDYKKALCYFRDNGIKVDIIFVDPPYKDMCIKDVLMYILEFNLLNEDGLVVCEYSFDKLDDSYLELSLIKSKKYGSTYVNIYKYLK